MFFRNPKSLELTHNYKSFSDYKDLVPMEGSDIQTGRVRFTAKENVKSVADNPFYDDLWYVVMRKGKYGAQIEKAVSEIYQHFLGDATEINIVKDNNDYYAASRGIKHFLPWSDCILKIQLLEDNSLAFVTDGQVKKIHGLGKLALLTEFFGDKDMSGGTNFGIQEREHDCIAVKIDNEHAFSFDEEVSSSNRDSEDENLDEDDKSGDLGMEDAIKNDIFLYFKVDITETDWFQNEKQEMQQLIAATDFSELEVILRNNITSNKIEAMEWMINHLLKFDSTQDKMSLDQPLENLHAMDSENMGVNQIVDILKSKHAMCCHPAACLPRNVL